MIFATDPLHQAARDVLKSFELVVAPADDSTVGRCEARIGWPSKLTLTLLDKMKVLLAIQTISAGVDDIDFAVIPPTVKIFSNAGVHAQPVAEHAWGLLLGIAKGTNVRKERVAPYRLQGRTLLVLGCGAIGSEVARIGKEAFGMKTFGLSRSFKRPEFFDSRLSMVILAGVIGEADAIVDCLPLNLQTRSILDLATLFRAKNRVIVVNVGRAETIDEISIAKILRDRPEMRFATDVFWRQNGRENFESQLWDLPNFGGSSHTAGGFGSEEALHHAELVAAENITQFLITGRAENEVRVEDYVES